MGRRNQGTGETVSMTQEPTFILIVEDDPAVARLLGGHLSQVGYDTQTEAYGRMALNRAVTRHPDLVILDIRLPDMSGYEVCRELRNLFPYWRIPVLMLTGLSQPADQLRGFAHGADAYLTKPCPIPELLQTIGLLLGEPTPT